MLSGAKHPATSNARHFSAKRDGVDTFSSSSELKPDLEVAGLFAKPVLSEAEGLRMIVAGLFRHLIIRHSLVIRHWLFVIFLLVFFTGFGPAFPQKRPLIEKDLV